MKLKNLFQVARHVYHIVSNAEETRQKIEGLQLEVGQVSAQVSQALGVINLDRRSSGRPKDAFSAANESSIPGGAGEVDGLFYLQFENRFRGREEELADRQAAYLQTFVEVENVLDVGCGRGEFLNLLKDRGISAKGIDTNEAMVDSCLEKGLDVTHADALAYLASLPDESLGGVFCSQVVEHMPPSVLLEFVAACFGKMQQGAPIVLETINPLSFTSLANFYLDPTHVKPVHPGGLRFVLEAYGFVGVETRFVSPLPEAGRLKRVENDKHDARTEILNENFARLNETLYGCQDFAVMARKP